MLKFNSLAKNIIFPKSSHIISHSQGVQIGNDGVSNTVVIKIPSDIFDNLLAKIFTEPSDFVNYKNF